MQDSSPTACLIIIGNEILSGRTKDTNLPWLGEQLNEIGVRLREARVIPDIHETIVATVNACRTAFDYVFTTGGIGPTHDDITSAAIAKAFGVALPRHPEAERLLRAHYGDQINEARLKMAEIPEGGTLIPNPVSIAPGYRIGNVFVLAGVPRIMQAMFEHAKHELRGGKKMLSRTLSIFVTEGTIAKGLTDIQNRFPEVEIGSYPFIRTNRLGTSLVLRCTNEARLGEACGQLRAFLETTGETVTEE